jgi:hypothetical protein
MGQRASFLIEGERLDVLPSRAKRRRGERHDVQPVDRRKRR